MRGPAIKDLVKGGALQLSLFDESDMANIMVPVGPLRGSAPDGRLIVCRNPGLAANHGHKRQELPDATERGPARIQTAVARKRDPPRGARAIALSVGAVIEKHKMRKHFDLDIVDTKLTFARETDTIAAEAAGDGICMVRTSLASKVLDDAATMRSYKSPSQVERAFRSMKTVDLQVRPVHRWLADRVRAHVFPRLLAYYLEQHPRRKLAPLLFGDTNKDAAGTERVSVVVKAQRSPAAIRRQTAGVAPDGTPVHSFRMPPANLPRLARDTIVTAAAPNLPLTAPTRPTTVQRRCSSC